MLARQAIVRGLWPKYAPETRALFAAMTVRPDATHARAIDTFIRGLKANGLWSIIDWMSGAGAQHASQASLINWKTPSQVGTAVGSPTFAVDGGWTFDGSTNYIDTGFIPSTNAVAMTASSTTIGVYERTNVASNGVAAGATSVAARKLIVNPRRASTSVIQGAVHSNLVDGAAAQSDSRGLTLTQQIAGAFTNWKNGSQVESYTATAAGSLVSNSIWIGAQNNAGVIANGRASQIATLVIASGWNTTQHATFYTLHQTCMTAIGAPV